LKGRDVIMSRETRNHTLENLEIELAWLLGCRTGDTPGVAYSDAAVEKLRQEIQHGGWQESVASASPDTKGAT
jgi:hypothetical protein